GAVGLALGNRSGPASPEPAGRRHRARPPAGRFRCGADDTDGAPHARQRDPVRAADHVRRRRHGQRHPGGAGRVTRPVVRPLSQRSNQPTVYSLGWFVEQRSSVPVGRRYDTLLAKGEDRKQRILDVAQRLLTRNGWRNTTLAQIAGEAGVTPAGLLHHFESKEQLLHAVLDIRDADDDANADRAGDLISEVAAVADRF